jgi:uncharacterized lipoprotein YmbA
MFFFEKKNQKTFASLGSLYPERPKPNDSKVFCFFFSKKKCLPLPPSAGDGSRFAVPPYLLAFAILSGCASPDANFYTLQPVPGPMATASSLTLAKDIEVRTPGLAGYLDRSDVVLKDADYRLGVNEQQRWAEPLADMIGRVLTEDLAQRLPQNSVFGQGGAISADPDARVEVDIQRFDADASGTVTLSAQVAIEAGRSHAPLMTRHVALTATPASPAPAALAATLSDLLGQLADVICGNGRGA